MTTKPRRRHTPVAPGGYHIQDFIGKKIDGATVIGYRVLEPGKWEFVVRNDLGEREVHVVEF
jgi:hypothetical protein